VSETGRSGPDGSGLGGPSGPTIPDRFAVARAVADAVLYEGYVLYPYRASAPKNQLRWQFGVLTPQAFSAADPSERSSLRTECLLAPGPAARLFVRVRCLQVQHRSLEVARPNGRTPDSDFAPIDTLKIDGVTFVEWDEAVDRVLDLPPWVVATQLTAPHEERFQLAGGSERELIRDDNGATAGRIVRSRQTVEGVVRVEVSEIPSELPLVKVAVTVRNLTPWTGTAARRHEVLSHSLVAVHAMLAVDDGSFISLLDPPLEAAGAAAGCHQDGVFPILIGTGDVMLASPIILYDRPEVAPESPGDLYDATEIDEILALRVLTLTDEEKAEARATDARAAAIIDRCDDMPPEVWSRLHGALRSLGPPAGEEADPTGGQVIAWWDPTADATADPDADSVMVGGVVVKKGTAVRLHPSHRADAHDLFLRDMTATVAGVFQDVDGSQHVAVTVDEDPATDELLWQGRYLYFHPDEIIPLPERGPR
jgi:hypothetical protein